MTPLLPGNELAAGKARAVLRPREGLTGRRRSPNYCRKKEKFGNGERAWATLLAKRRPGTKKVPQWDLQWGTWARAAFETRTASQSRDTGQRCCVLLPSGPLPITPQKVGPGAEPHSSHQLPVHSQGQPLHQLSTRFSNLHNNRHHCAQGKTEAQNG